MRNSKWFRFSSVALAATLGLVLSVGLSDASAAPRVQSTTAAAIVPGGYIDSLSVTPDLSTWTLVGWAIDFQAPTVAIPVDVYIDGLPIMRATAGDARDDLAAAFPTAGADHGFTIAVPAPTAPGTHYACVYAINTNGVGPNTGLGCRKVTVPNPFLVAPTGFIDMLAGSPDGSTWTLVGWTIDFKAPTTVLTVHVYIDGVFATAALAGDVRDDVAAVFPTAGAAHGYTIAVAAPLTPGTHFACVYAINTNGVGPNTGLGCRKVTV